MRPFVVFDLDGTLIDSRRDLAESTNEMLGTFGAPARPLDEVAGMVGEGARKLVERALAAAGLHADLDDALERFRASYDRRLFNHTVPYDGIAGVLARAAGRATLAVLSNKPEAPTRRLLEHFALASHFTAVLGGDSPCPRKPDPAGLRHLMQQAGAGPAATLFVGDSMIDVETAERAAVRLCVVLYGFGALRGDLVVPARAWTANRPADVDGVITEFTGEFRSTM